MTHRQQSRDNINGVNSASGSDSTSGTELFRRATRDVQPLRKGGQDKTVLATPPPKPRAKFTRADQKSVLIESLTAITDDSIDPADLDTGEELSFRRPGVAESTLRKLRRGHFAVREELDLHGLTSPQARQLIREFIAEQLTFGARCVRIIHGKGRGSGPRGPVLKNVVNRDLRRINAVVAFGSARQIDGGSGAVYVLLHRPSA
jgi:DNA-nicking Smr family endonuclease